MKIDVSKKYNLEQPEAEGKGGQNVNKVETMVERLIFILVDHPS
jgi:protein subunit release factor B